TQNTNWKNVEKAILNLKQANAMTPTSLHIMEPECLAQLIRPAGYYNIKAQRLKNFLNFLFTEYDGEVDRLETIPTDQLRNQLLAIKGIGAETADSILLYAYNREVFVVDTYTCRIFFRHLLIEPEGGYEQVRYFFESSLPDDSDLFNEYHALLVQAGKEYCKPKAKCNGCPLEKLPHEIDPLAY
ncbi:MAG: hypothetical protein KAS23_07825, partial [Anaerohalosphaera sp.]|nr:hypothetical protein [Anaerohalosphaera sp.]